MESERIKEIRVRIAPSPTGNLHIGTARAALMNYLFAKKMGGKFLVRIEDTDKERSKKEFEENIIEGLKWLGIDWDEGIEKEGEYGPYRQSERNEKYRKYLQKLLDENKAYYCFCKEEDLKAQKDYSMASGGFSIYSEKCASIPKEEALKRIKNGESAVIRFRTPKEKIKFKDLIRNEIEFDGALIGDFVIAKNLDNALYNFAVVVDDYEMKISHVIRGEDHISNTPKQIILQKALEFDIPKYAHLPLILGSDKSKLSKRHGATSIVEYKEQGYLPEALINFIAFLGWNPGDDREIFSLEELSKEFSLERVQKGGAIFNVIKLDFYNSYYIKNKTIDELTKLCLPFLQKSGLINEQLISKSGEQFTIDDIQKYVSIYQERLKKLSEISELVDSFFKEPIYEKNLLIWKNMSEVEIRTSLDRSEEILRNIDNFSLENVSEILLEEAEKMGNRGVLLWPLRAALSGKEVSASPFELAFALGKEKTLMRIKKAKELL